MITGHPDGSALGSICRSGQAGQYNYCRKKQVAHAVTGCVFLGLSRYRNNNVSGIVSSVHPVPHQTEPKDHATAASGTNYFHEAA